MVISLPDAERQLLRQAQRACRGKTEYVPVTVLLLLDRGQTVGAIAEDLGLDEATVYRYAQTYREKGLAGYLRACAGNWTKRCTPTAGPSLLTSTATTW